MATLPPATTICSSHLDEAVSRLLVFSGEVFSLRNLHKQRLPISHSKQNAPFAFCEKSSVWRISGMAASAPQANVSLGVIEGAEECREELDERDEEGAAAEGSLFDWNSQWYPVSMTDDLDRRFPTAITIMGRHLVVSWDNVRRSWKVWNEMGSEMTAPLSDPQSSGKSDSQFSLLFSPLKCSSGNDCASVYPSVEQDGLLWFWPDTRAEFENIAARKPPPSIPALTDPTFKDKLYSMNLPYGYKKMIENLLGPAYLPFAHDEPHVDLLEDFEKNFSTMAGQSSNKPCSEYTYKRNQNHFSSSTNGHAQNVGSLGSKNTKAVKSGIANLKLELSYSAAQNDAPARRSNTYSKTIGTFNALLKLSYANVENCGCGHSISVFGKTNGSTSAKMEIPYRARQSDALDNGITIDSQRNGNAIEAGNYASNTTKAAVKDGSDNPKSPNAYAASQKGADGSIKTLSRDTFVQATEGGLQSGEILSQSLLEGSVQKEVLETDRVELGMAGNASRGETNVSRVQSSVVLKKPGSSARTKFKEKVSGRGDPLNISTNSSKSRPEGVISEGSRVSCLDLTSSLQTLRRMIFKKDYQLAKEHVKELYQKFPRDTGVLMEYAFVEKQLGDLVAAGSLYSKAVSAFEDQQNLGYDYVRALQALGSIEARARNARRARVLFMESIRAARQAEQLVPDLVSGASVYGLHAWARLELQLGNWAKARDLLTRAADIQPGNAVVHQSRAHLEAKVHNWGAARHHFSLAVESAPEDVKCWHAWAIFEAGQGKQKKMRELFQKALELDPYSVHCLQAWAHQETLIRTPESVDKARSLFQRCTQIEPKSLYAWQAWAVLEQASGNYDKARELFEMCLEINPSSVACLQAFANMERHLKDWGAAQRLLRKALKLEPENAAVLMEAAFVENSLGNTEVAERLFVLAGMADKRKRRVTNRIFASRKEVMFSQVGEGWRAFGKEGEKPIIDFNVAVVANKARQGDPNSTIIGEGESAPIKAANNAINVKREEGNSSHLKTPSRSSSHLKQGDSNNYTKEIATVLMDLKQGDSNSFEKNLVKPRGPMKKSGGETKSISHSKQKDRISTDFKVAIDAIKAKQRELRSVKRQRKNKPRSNFQAAIGAIEAKLREHNDDLEVEPIESTRLSRSMLGA